MKLRLFATLFFVLAVIGLSAKENPFVIKLQSGDELFQQLDVNASLSSIINNSKSEYFLVQFYSVPTESEKKNLEKNGVRLLEYIPNNTFISRISAPSGQLLSKLNIRSIIEFNEKFKTSNKFNINETPIHAQLNSNKVELIINMHLDANNLEIESYFLSNGIQVNEKSSNSEFFEIELDKKLFDDLIKNDFVKFIEFIPTPPEPEDTRARSLHRNNVIDSDHPLGRKYDGTGVSISIADDGTIGPHIDLTGRFTQPNMADRGTHGDMTTGIAMGAGNLDPRYKGMAPGAFLYYFDIGGYPHISNAVSNLNNNRVVITSTSYSEGCNAGYTATTRQVDQQTRQNEELLHVFSAGNSSSSTCGTNAYGAGTPWGTITGGRKQGKAVIATGNLDYRGSLTASSSRGPASDGRIKPDICSNGTNQISTDPNNSYSPGGGTSAAAPGIAGISAQLYHAYRTLNNGNDPNSGLIKAAMLNTAKDLGNRGPDFFYGWGRVNAYKALQLIESRRYADSTITQGTTNTHTLTIPANLEQLRVMVYWTDFEATTNSSRALVNNIDFKLVTPLNDTINPWVLNSSPNATALNTPAVRGIDDLNNMEQVTIDTVPAGAYTILINGKAIPNGPQQYYILWENVTNQIEVTYPYGGESFVPNETETVRWDAYGDQGSFNLQYSINNGATWANIGSVTGDRRYSSWRVPNSLNAEKGLLRVQRSGISDVSDFEFSIIRTPQNLRVDYICPDSVLLAWDSVAGATSYEVSQLGNKYMDSIGTTSNLNFKVYNLNLSDDNWFAVKAKGNGIIGRRTIALLIPKVTQNCPLPYDVEVSNFISPASSTVQACNSTKIPISVTIKNAGDSVLNNIPLIFRAGSTVFNDTLKTPMNSNSILTFTFSDSLITTGITGNLNISVTSKLATDDNATNDSISDVLNIFQSAVFSLPYSNNFENFIRCNTFNDCGATTCNLNGGWINVPNGGDDVHDMRVNSGPTPSSGTGPSIDHNPGTASGKYLYSEASNGCYQVVSQVLSPCFDLSGTISPEFSFWYHILGTNPGFIQLDILSNGTWTNDIITPLFSSATPWRQSTVNLSSYAGQTVTLRFRITTGSFWSSDMAIDDVSLIDNAVSTKELLSNDVFNIYPNPSAGNFTIEFSDNSNKNFRVFDIQGRLIHNETLISTINQIDLSHLKKGIYFVDIDDGLRREKIIIQ